MHLSLRRIEEALGGLECERDEERLREGAITRAAEAGGEFGDEIGNGLELERKSLLRSTELARGERLGGTVIGDGGGHDEEIASVGVFLEEPAKVGGCSEPQGGNVRIVGFGNARAEEERDACAATVRFVGERFAERAGGAVAEVADLVDGFVGGPGGDEEAYVAADVVGHSGGRIAWVSVIETGATAGGAGDVRACPRRCGVG